MRLKYQAALMTVALALGSCASDELFGEGNSADGAMGQVNKPGVEVNNAEKVVSDAKKAQSRASYDVSNYILDFYRAGESDPFTSYVYKDMEAAVELPAGDYSVSVRSHNVAKAEWDKPYFTGKSEQFTVEAEKITTVKPIKCVFSSLKVTVKFGEKLRQAMGDDVQVTVVANDEGKLTYTPSETRAGYFEALEGSVSLAATFTGMVNGHAESFTRAFGDVAKGQHRIITFETGGSLPEPEQPSGSVEIGGLQIDFSYEDVNLDGSVDPGKEDVIGGDEDEPGTLPDIKDPDEEKPNPPVDPEDPDEPKVETITFGGTLKDGGNYSVTELDVYNVVINVEKGIKDMKVEIQSEDGLTPAALSDVGLTDKFSLVNPGEYEAGLAGLGFPIKDAVANQTNLTIDITSFMTLIPVLNGGNSSNTFVMTITDNENTVKPLSFTIYSKK